MQIPRKYQRLITSIISVFIFSCIISFGMTAVRLGFGDGFLAAWMNGWLTAYLIVFPTIWFLAPPIAKWVATRFPFAD